MDRLEDRFGLAFTCRSAAALGICDAEGINARFQSAYFRCRLSVAPLKHIGRRPAAGYCNQSAVVVANAANISFVGLEKEWRRFVYLRGSRQRTAVRIGYTERISTHG